MPSTKRRQCAACGRLARPRNRFCAQHGHRLTRYGNALAMPLTYRTHVAPRFHRWCLDGYRRLADHPAMAAGRELAARCLAYTYEPDPSVVQVAGWRHAAQAMRLLRDNGATPEQLMLRVAEMVALFDAEPHRCPSQTAEDMALGRAVLHILRWQGEGRGQSKTLTLAVARHVREQLYAWAAAFVRKLHADQDKDAELAKRAATFD